MARIGRCSASGVDIPWGPDSPTLPAVRSSREFQATRRGKDETRDPGQKGQGRQFVRVIQMALGRAAYAIDDQYCDYASIALIIDDKVLGKQLYHDRRTSIWGAGSHFGSAA